MMVEKDHAGKLGQSPVKVMTECRACGGRKLERVLDLGEQPLANSFLPGRDLERELEEELVVPLEVHSCAGCGLLQLIHVVSPEVLFRDFLFPFEIVSVLLLAAVIGGVFLAKREPGGPS